MEELAESITSKRSDVFFFGFFRKTGFEGILSYFSLGIDKTKGFKSLIA